MTFLKIIFEYVITAITIGMIIRNIWEIINRIIEGKFKKAIADIITTILLVVLLYIIM